MINSIPNGPAGSPAANDPLQGALYALQGQRPDEAVRIATEMLRKQPGHARALHVLGCALLMQGRPQDAIAPLEQAGRGRRDPEIETQLAIALRQTGRPEEALTKLKRVVKRQPPYAAAFHELGYLLFSMQRYEEAVDVLRRGIGVAPMMPELYVQLGYVFLRRRAHASARDAFAHALNIVPGSLDALFGMALAHFEDAQYAAAAEFYRCYLAGRPDDANVWLNLGHCLLALGQKDAGYDCFRAATRHDPARYGNALNSLVKANRGRFWLKPSDAARFFRDKQN